MQPTTYRTRDVPQYHVNQPRVVGRSTGLPQSEQRPNDGRSGAGHRGRPLWRPSPVVLQSITQEQVEHEARGSDLTIGAFAEITAREYAHTCGWDTARMCFRGQL